MAVLWTELAHAEGLGIRCELVIHCAAISAVKVVGTNY